MDSRLHTPLCRTQRQGWSWLSSAASVRLRIAAYKGGDHAVNVPDIGFQSQNFSAGAARLHKLRVLRPQLATFPFEELAERVRLQFAGGRGTPSFFLPGHWASVSPKTMSSDGRHSRAIYLRTAFTRRTQAPTMMGVGVFPSAPPHNLRGRGRTTSGCKRLRQLGLCFPSGNLSDSSISWSRLTFTWC